MYLIKKLNSHNEIIKIIKKNLQKNNNKRVKKTFHDNEICKKNKQFKK